LPAIPGGRVPKHHTEFAFCAGIALWNLVLGFTCPIDKT
jgi:hypothetical protein